MHKLLARLIRKYGELIQDSGMSVNCYIYQLGIFYLASYGDENFWHEDVWCKIDISSWKGE